jgi:hypothetical protein
MQSLLRSGTTDFALPNVLFVVAFAATIFCTAINCYTYQIAYPLWASVGPEYFPAVHREYLRRLEWIITIPHMVMFFSAAALVFRHPVFIAPVAASWLFGLEAAVVGVSAFAAGPIHSRFTRTGIADATGLAQLVRISLLRTLLMIAACGIVCRCLLAGLAA